jgi:hypothetical protein
MDTQLVEQHWFVEAVQPTAEEKIYLGEHFAVFFKRVNDYQALGMEAKKASILAAKEMLGK